MVLPAAIHFLHQRNNMTVKDFIDSSDNAAAKNVNKIDRPSSKIGLVIGGAFGVAGLAIMALATPFVLPALRKHCLPYVPATDTQLSNLSKAFKKHVKKGDSLLDIGSGDGRICRLSAKLNLFNRIEGVELNYILVLFSRLMEFRYGLSKKVIYHHRDLWHFPISNYDNICIFGVESMMSPLEKYLKLSNNKTQTVFACRFPFDNMSLVDEIGCGIDTVWVYKLPAPNEKPNETI